MLRPGTTSMARRHLQHERGRVRPHSVRAQHAWRATDGATHLRNAWTHATAVSTSVVRLTYACGHVEDQPSGGGDKRATASPLRQGVLAHHLDALPSRVGGDVLQHLERRANEVHSLAAPACASCVQAP